MSATEADHPWRRLLYGVAGAVLAALILWFANLWDSPFVTAREYRGESFSSRITSVEDDVGELKGRLDAIDSKLDDVKTDTGKIDTLEKLVIKLLED